MYSKEEQKKAAAWQAAMEVEDNMVLGLGTGSTVYYLMEKLSERIRGGLNIHGAATSLETEGLARRLGIPPYLPGGCPDHTPGYGRGGRH